MRSSLSRTVLLDAIAASLVASPAGPAWAVVVSSEFEVVKTFLSTGCLDPSQPAAPLVRGSDGALYGVTPLGGSATLCTVFRIDSAGNLSSLHSFNGEDG